MAYRLEDLAIKLGVEFVGDSDVLIEGIGSLTRAVPGQITFFRNRRFRNQLQDTRASAVLLGAGDKNLSSLPRLVCDDPHVTFALLTRIFSSKPRFPMGIHPSAVVGDDCEIGKGVSIAPGVVIGAKVVIGDDCVVGPNCTLNDNCTLGDRCRLVANVVIDHGAQLGNEVLVHPGVKIGNDGFGFADNQGTWTRIFHQGMVIVGDDVEIGANTTVDRGTIDNTVIEKGVKIDNQVQIAHNVRIGAHTIIAGCTGIAGSVTIGCHCRIGGAAMIADQLSICDNVSIGGGTLVLESIREPGVYVSLLSIQQYERWRKNSVYLRNLDKIVKRLKNLERKLAKNNKIESDLDG